MKGLIVLLSSLFYLMLFTACEKATFDTTGEFSSDVEVISEEEAQAIDEMGMEEGQQEGTLGDDDDDSSDDGASDHTAGDDDDDDEYVKAGDDDDDDDDDSSDMGGDKDRVGEGGCKKRTPREIYNDPEMLERAACDGREHPKKLWICKYKDGREDSGHNLCVSMSSISLELHYSKLRADSDEVYTSSKRKHRRGHNRFRRQDTYRLGLCEDQQQSPEEEDDDSSEEE